MAEQVTTGSWQIRHAEWGDAADILAVSDEATVWLVDHGLSDQWGGEPPSSEPSFVSRVSDWIRDGQAMVAIDVNRNVQGYAVTGSFPPPYLDPEIAGRAVEDAYYVYTVATRMVPASRGAGRSLLLRAADRARALGVTYLRLDCWADNTQLRAYYESLGFNQCDAYTDDGWRGVVLQSRL
jgi:ribosomal protein S18 acetylase RimI-like enzyme